MVKALVTGQHEDELGSQSPFKHQVGVAFHLWFQPQKWGQGIPEPAGW